MEGGFCSDRNETSSFFGSENLEDELEVGIVKSEEILSQIPQPQTPRESMKFLSRSWSLSASEISKALAQKQRQQRDLLSVAHNPKVFFQDVAADPLMVEKITNSSRNRRSGRLSKWFHHTQHTNPSTMKMSNKKDKARVEKVEKIMNSSGNRRSGRLSKWFHHTQHTNPNTMKMSNKKDKARVEKARVHSAVSIAALAAGLASVTSEESCSKESSSRMALALASATELLALHFIEMAEQAGADCTCIASTVRSSIDIQSPCDLMTLTAAAATALRGEAALKVRHPKEARKKATITPCERSFSDSHLPADCQFRLEEPNIPLEGELMQCAQNGVQRIKQVCVYINKKSQVMIKLKSKHVRRAFSKKIKCVVNGVYDEMSARPYGKERENSEEVYFSLKTGHGLLEFMCKSKMQKQRWVAGILSYLSQVTCFEAAECSLESLSLSDRMR